MTVTRRTFLRSGAMTALLTGLTLDSIPRAFAQQSQTHDAAHDSAFKRETFLPYLHGAFALNAGAHSVDATLVSVRNWTPNPKLAKLTRKTRKSDSFALVFRSKEKLTDLTTIYDVEHAALGRFPLFLTRRKGQQHGTYFYEAVFNHAL